MSPTFIRLTAQERAIGLPLANEPIPGGWDGAASRTRESPRAALETILRPAVERDRCYVLFSGGRDSSALLALATSLARASGAPDPVPITGRHPDAPASDETGWQELVLRHLGITEHIVIEFRGEQALLSDGALKSLSRRGLLWPTPLHVQPAYLTGLPRGGTIITGEGGDLTVSGRRITEIRAAIRARRQRHSPRLIGSSVIPVPATTVRRDYARALPWLTPAGGDVLAGMIRAQREPLGAAADLRKAVSRRPIRMGGANITSVFADEGFASIHPFDHPRFIAAIAREGGFFGSGDRTALMRRMFADLLPDQVLSRSTKAAFNAARFTDQEHEFARSWSGAGIDPRYIDPEKLRDAWLSEAAPPASAIHLHAAWLAENGLPLDPDGT